LQNDFLFFSVSNLCLYSFLVQINSVRYTISHSIGQGKRLALIAEYLFKYLQGLSVFVDCWQSFRHQESSSMLFSVNLTFVSTFPIFNRVKNLSHWRLLLECGSCYLLKGSGPLLITGVSSYGYDLNIAPSNCSI
jgi:hypothetical protein